MRDSRIGTFDLNLLRIFDAIFQRGSINSAANEIGISSSAASHALGRLRHIFNDDLFVKEAGQMVPTARATQIVDRVSSILLQVRSILGPAEFNPETSERHFKLHCNDYVGTLILPHVMKQIRNIAPRVKVTANLQDKKNIDDELDAGIIDLAVGTFNRVPARFDCEDLLSDRWIWVLRSDHPCLLSPLTREKLFQLPKLIIASSEVERGSDDIIADVGRERSAVADRLLQSDEVTSSGCRAPVKGVLIINNPNAAPAILSQSDLVALLPKRLAFIMCQLYKLNTIELDEEAGDTMRHRIIWHRKYSVDPAIDWLRCIIRTATSTVGS